MKGTHLSEALGIPPLPAREDMKETLRSYFPSRCSGCPEIESVLERATSHVNDWEEYDAILPIVKEQAENTRRACEKGVGIEEVNPEIQRTRIICGKLALRMDNPSL